MTHRELDRLRDIRSVLAQIEAYTGTTMDLLNDWVRGARHGALTGLSLGAFYVGWKFSLMVADFLRTIPIIG